MNLSQADMSMEPHPGEPCSYCHLLAPGKQVAMATKCCSNSRSTSLKTRLPHCASCAGIMNRAKSQCKELDTLRGMSSEPRTWMDVGMAAVASVDTPQSSQTTVPIATPTGERVGEAVRVTAEYLVVESTSANSQHVLASSV